MPAIPPILANGKLVSDFRIKSELFNSHFPAQCTPVKNGSTLPKFKYRTNKRLYSFTINENDIFLIIKDPYADKAYGWANISIRIIQSCGKENSLPLQLRFKSMLEEGIFPEDWKKCNVVPVYKKVSTNLINNYRPISLLPIFSKIFERLVFNSLLNYFMQNKLFRDCQSGFIPGDSCVAQLLSITHEIYKSFDCNPPADTRGTFLDISKAFDKFWHEGLIFKLKTYGIDGDLLKLLINCLEDHKQRVALNGQTSSRKNILAGVPQGSVLGPILFLIYIYDLPDGIKSICKIFANDASLFSKVKDKNCSTVKLNNDLEIISN